MHNSVIKSRIVTTSEPRQAAKYEEYCHDVLVLGTRVAISDTARDLGVVIDRELYWRPMSRPSVAPVTTSYASSDQ